MCRHFVYLVDVSGRSLIRKRLCDAVALASSRNCAGFLFSATHRTQKKPLLPKSLICCMYQKSHAQPKKYTPQPGMNKYDDILVTMRKCVESGSPVDDEED